MNLKLVEWVNPLRRKLEAEGMELLVQWRTDPGCFQLSLTQPYPPGRPWDRRRMLTRLRELLPELDPPARIKVETLRPFDVFRREDGSLVLQQLNGQYETFEINPGREEFSFGPVAGKWYHLLPVDGQETSPARLKRFSRWLQDYRSDDWLVTALK